MPELNCNFEIWGGVEILSDLTLCEKLRLEVVALEVGDCRRDVDGQT